MRFNICIQNFVSDFARLLREDSAAIFAGAGLSAGSGYVNWSELLKEPARRIGLDSSKETDMVTLAQYIYNGENTKQPLAELIKNSFRHGGRLNNNHKILARLPIRTFWTTNYDSLIENSLEEAGKNPDIKKRIADLTSIKSRRDAVVYKMHGDVDIANDVILIKDDYELYDTKNQLFTINLKSDLVSKTFLFIGFSFEDPNLEYILSKVKILTQGYTRQHYCFIRKVNRESYEAGEEGEKEFQYDLIKQGLKCADLKRYCIVPLIVDEYENITEILKMVEERYKMTRILISGSSEEYSEFNLKGIEGKEFAYKLSIELNRTNYKIVTGFGNGIGSAVINGVVDNINTTNTRNLDDHLVIRPFPQYANNGQDYESIKKQYRSSLVNESGIAIFVFGNKKDKKDDDKIIIADGVIDEFEMAIENGIKVIPIGATGYASKILWDKVITNFNDYFPDHSYLKDKFELLGSQMEYKDIIEIVLNIIEELNKVV